MGIADLIIHTGIVQDPLSERGLAGIDVSHDADVSRTLKRIVSSRHEFFLQ